MQWTIDDRRAFEARGWSLEYVDYVIDRLLSGPDASRAVRPAVLGDGIEQLTEVDRAACRVRLQAVGAWARFIPASGAATRMFSGFEGPTRERSLALWQAHAHRTGLQLPGEGAEAAIRYWAGLPKGFLPFLPGEDGWLSAFEAHALENGLGSVEAALHFSVPEGFEERASEAVVAGWHVQPPSTDLLAWDVAAAAPARNGDGSLLFRPGGHGALLGAFASLGAPLVAIRNVDNVVPLDTMPLRAAWSEALAGRALQLVEERDDVFAVLEATGDWEPAAEWLRPFCAQPVESKEAVRDALCRPIRVAGMVQASGHTGGGPFWVRAEQGNARLGILEGVEVPEGLPTGTHFNPVELVCALQLPGGCHMVAQDFANPAACFASTKVIGGRAVRILEHPGLWNGGMEGWLTRFVELPSSVFRPVKTWEDLIPQ